MVACTKPVGSREQFPYEIELEGGRGKLELFSCKPVRNEASYRNRDGDEVMVVDESGQLYAELEDFFQICPDLEMD